MGRRQVILLTNSFSIYYTEWKLFYKKHLQGLTNTTVISVLINDLLICKSLNQEIIKA